MGYSVERTPLPIRRLYTLAVLLAVAVIPALVIDLPVSAWFRRAGFPDEVAKMFRLTEVFGHGTGVALILVTAAVLDSGRYSRWPRVVACTYGAGLANNLIKLSVGRFRPCEREFSSICETFLGWFPNGAKIWSGSSVIQSFPSGHVATATGLAIGLAWLYPRGRWLFACFAAMVAVQRWQDKAHYPSDTLAGAAVACFVAACCLDRRCLGGWFDRWEQSSGAEPRIERESEAGRERDVVEPSDRRVFVADAKDTLRIRTGQRKSAT